VWERGSLLKALKEIFRKSPEEEAAEFTEEIAELVDEGEEKGFISPEEGEMIVNIVQFRNVPVREVMVPRIDIVAVDANVPLSELLEVVIERGHSRIPVYEDTIDNIIGLIYAKDLLSVTRDPAAEFNLKERLQGPGPVHTRSLVYLLGYTLKPRQKNNKPPAETLPAVDQGNAA